MSTDRAKLQRLLLTGAAGGLGKVLRESLRPFTPTSLRLSDLARHGPEPAPDEEVVPCDLADKAAVDRLVPGLRCHRAPGRRFRSSAPFEEILEANIKGVFHLYEGARRHGVKRVVFASSNHVIGFHEQGEVLDADSPRRPDGYYGLSKAYRRRPVALLLRPLRHRDRLPAHRLLVPRAQGPPDACPPG